MREAAERDAVALNLAVVVDALSSIRLQRVGDELAIHTMIRAILTDRGIPYRYEPILTDRRCRPDFLARGVAIEVKRRRPHEGRTLAQCTRYAACEEIDAVVLVVQRDIPMPEAIDGVPVRCVSLDRAWGIAL